MSTVFIAYAKEDQEAVAPILDELRRSGHDVFDGGKPASDVDVEAAVEISDCTIVLWSGASTNDEPVRIAAQAAKADGVLIPAFVEKTFPAFGYGLINGIHLEDWGGDPGETVWQDLLARINDVAGPFVAKGAPNIRKPQAPPPPPPRRDPTPEPEPAPPSIFSTPSEQPPEPEQRNLPAPIEPERPQSDPAPQARTGIERHTASSDPDAASVSRRDVSRLAQFGAPIPAEPLGRKPSLMDRMLSRSGKKSQNGPPPGPTVFDPKPGADKPGGLKKSHAILAGSAVAIVGVGLAASLLMTASTDQSGDAIVDASEASAPLANETARTVLADERADDAAFAAARSDDTPAAYRAYLAARPFGRHADEARAAIASKLEAEERASAAVAAPPEAVTTPAAPSSDSDISADETVEPSRETDIVREQVSADVERMTEARRIAEEAEELERLKAAEDRSLWQAAEELDQASGYRAYLDTRPDGMFAADARAALADIERKAAEAREAELEAERLGLTSVAAAAANGPEEDAGASEEDESDTARASEEAAGPLITPFSVDQMTPYVAQAVLDARAAQTQAEAASALAEQAAVGARQAALAAERGDSGHRVRSVRRGNVLSSGLGVDAWYRGQWRRGKDGLGCEKENVPELILGDADVIAAFWDLPGYCGEWSDNERSGHGAYFDIRSRYSYSGGWSKDVASGFAVIDNAKVPSSPAPVVYYGQVSEGRMSGFGVIEYPDGRRYEGRLADGTAHGYGVLWAPGGAPMGAGRWVEGRIENDEENSG